jgi:hypothetical protein
MAARHAVRNAPYKSKPEPEARPDPREGVAGKYGMVDPSPLPGWRKRVDTTLDRIFGFGDAPRLGAGSIR